jgi:hypothetical protein
MVDQYTPQGSMTYSQIDGTGPQTNFNEDAYNSALSAWQNAGGSNQSGLPADFNYRNASTEDIRLAEQGNRSAMPTVADFTTTTNEDGVPRYQATTSYSPEEQAIYESGRTARQTYADIGNSQLSQVQETLSNPYEYSGAARQMSVGTDGLPDLRSSAAATQNVRYNIDNAGTINRDIADAGSIARNLDFSRYGDLNITRDNVQDALLQRLQPSLDTDRAALETQLANQGLTPGTPAYDRAIDAANRQSNDARLAAIAQAGTEQSRLFGMGLNDAQFRNAAQGQQFGQNATRAGFTNQAQAQQYGQNANDAAFFNTAQGQEFGQDFSNAQLTNSARAQGFNERLSQAQFANNARDAQIAQELALRDRPINETAALFQGSQVQAPQFVNTPTAGVQAPDIAGLTMANYQQQAQNANSANQGLYSLLGAGAGLASGTYGGAGWTFSDRRLKRDVTPIGKLGNGLTVYSYRYTWSKAPEIGLMADEVAALRPWAVKRVGSHDMVNYAEAIQ